MLSTESENVFSMPDDVKIGKASNNNWYEYQASFIAESDSKSSNYNDWMDAICEELTHEHEFYFIEDSSKKLRFLGNKTERVAKAVVAKAVEKFDGQLTDECNNELYTNGITATDNETFYRLWTESCDEFADRLINEATVDFIKHHQNNPLEEFTKHLTKIYPEKSDIPLMGSYASEYPQLLKSFECNPFPSVEEKLALMNTTGLSRTTLNEWFKHERDRRRKNGEDLIKYPSLGDKYPDLVKHFDKYPFPSSEDMLELMNITGLSRMQVANWFKHERNRRRKNGDISIKWPSLSNKHSELEESFKRNPYTSTEEKHRLMNTTGLSRKTLDNWFYGERKRRKKNGENLIKKPSLSDQYPDLKKQFDKDPYLNHLELKNLAASTGLTENQIRQKFKYYQKKNELPVQDFRESISKYPQLKDQFKNTPYPSESDFDRLVIETGLSDRQVYDWFQRKQRLNGLSGPVIRDRTRRSGRSLENTYPELQQQFDIDPFPSKDQS